MAAREKSHVVRGIRRGVIEHGRVLVSACHAMGLTDVDKYGSLDMGSGPLSGLFK